MREENVARKVDFKNGDIGIRMVPVVLTLLSLSIFWPISSIGNNNSNALLIDVLDFPGDGTMMVFAAVLIISRLDYQYAPDRTKSLTQLLKYFPRHNLFNSLSNLQNFAFTLLFAYGPLPSRVV